MTNEEFEKAAADAFDALPEVFKGRIENVHIVVEDFPSEETRRKVGLSRHALLLGLYEGVPLPHRGQGYGVSATIPDKITLYKKSIESVLQPGETLAGKIREVLIHEIAHYFGMNDDEIHAAGY
jgi:predicted Zn-dependent protease with MMP-like domain